MADMLSQEEIDALLKGTSTEPDSNNDVLSDEEKDALGEIGNISMGTAATTLFTLLGQKVTITTPKVAEITVEELSNYHSIPCVAVLIKYKEGIEGFNLLILKEKDVKIITDLMMGGDGTNLAEELTDLHLSAICEAMNQMIGSASTSLSEIFSKKIDILPPEAYPINLAEKDFGSISLDSKDSIARIAFSMTVGSIIDSEIMQIIPIEYAKQLVSGLLNSNNEPIQDIQKEESNSVESNRANSSGDVQNNTHFHQENQPSKNNSSAQKPVNVKSLEFESFDNVRAEQEIQSDISLIKDVPLGITVELGRTVKKVSEILDFGPGTVIELDKLVGESLDILVNGKQIAKGEVVVVDENYGIRITDILVHQNTLAKI